jgi:hypothetical protein
MPFDIPTLCHIDIADLIIKQPHGGGYALKAALTALIVGFVLTASSVHAQSTPSLSLEGTGNLGPGPGACASVGCSGQFSAMLSGQLGQAVSQATLQINLQLENQFVCTCGPQALFPCPLIPCKAQTDGLANQVPLPALSANSRATPKSGTKKPNLEAQILVLQQQTQSLQQQVDALKSGGIGFPFSAGCRPATGTGTFSGTQYSVNFTGQICSDNANNLELAGTIEIVQSPLNAGLVTWAAGTLVASGSIHIPAVTSANPIPISGPMVVSIVGAVGEVPGLVP